MAVFNLEKFVLESGPCLSDIKVFYQIFGEISPAKKIIWVCHALTANANPQEWWPGLFGAGQIFDSEKYCIVCANILGSCYGTEFKSSVPKPLITVRDMVKMHQKLAKFLEIAQIDLLIGGSLGGMQALEWAVKDSKFVKNLCVIATNANHSPWGKAFNEAQRMALFAGKDGIKTARAIALLSYRTYETFEKTQQDSSESLEDFRAASYLTYQGEKFKKRFSADSYFVLTKAMDSHNLGRHRKSVENALSKISAKTLVIGISSDILFPVSEQQFLAKHIQKCDFEIIDSIYGHDGFLLETKQIENLLEKCFSDLFKKKLKNG